MEDRLFKVSSGRAFFLLFVSKWSVLSCSEFTIPIWFFVTIFFPSWSLHTFSPMCINYPLSGFSLSLFLGHSLIHLCLIFPGSVFSNLLTVDYTVFTSQHGNAWQMVEEVLTAEVILIDSSLSKKVIIYWFPIIFNVMAAKKGFN